MLKLLDLNCSLSRLNEQYRIWMRSVNGVGHLDQGIFTNCTSLHEDKVQRVRSHVGDGSAPQDLSVLLDISVIIQLCVLQPPRGSWATGTPSSGCRSTTQESKHRKWVRDWNSRLHTPGMKGTETQKKTANGLTRMTIVVLSNVVEQSITRVFLTAQ